MIQERKELHDIKHYDTGMVLLEPPCMNKVDEVNASIGYGPLSNAAKLIWVQETIIYHVKLESIADDFLDELASSVK